MRWVKTAAITAVTACGVGLAALFAGRRLSDLAIRPDRGDAQRGTGPGAALRITAVDDETVSLSRGQGATTPGEYAMLWPGGRAVVGEPQSATSTRHTVTRSLVRVDEGAPQPGETVQFSPQLYRGGPYQALGVDANEVTIPSEIGELPAWYVPGMRTTWIVAAHGLGTDRDLALNLLRVFDSFRLPVLSLNYRGDPGAPPAPDNTDRFGATEWHDLAAAVRTARDAGARRVVLYGWSTGAAMALRAAMQPEQRPLVTGMALDSPVLDWRTVVRGRAAAHHVPAALVPLGVWATEGRTGLRQGGEPEPPADTPGPTTAKRDTRNPPPAGPEHYEIHVPTLFFHSPDDALASDTDTQRLAARFESRTSYVSTPRAGHCGGWNVAPERYEEALRRFLTPLV